MPWEASQGLSAYQGPLGRVSLDRRFQQGAGPWGQFSFCTKELPMLMAGFHTLGESPARQELEKPFRAASCQGAVLHRVGVCWWDRQKARSLWGWGRGRGLLWGRS